MVPKSSIQSSGTVAADISICATALIVALLVSIPDGVARSDAPALSKSSSPVASSLSGHGLGPVRSAVRLAAAAAGDKEEDRFESILAEVRRLVAAYFGVPVEDVAEATDLIADLYADPMDAIEMLARLCDRFQVPFPHREDLTSVEALARYIEWAEKNVASGQDSKPATRSRRGTKVETQAAPKEGGKADETAEADIYRQTVFFGTDRRPTGENDPHEMFGGERGNSEGLTYGVAEVSIPVAVHKKGKIERPGLFEIKEDPKRHIVLQRVEPLAREDFMLSLNGFLERDDKLGAAGGDAFVFIHGYNVTFERAARRTAQITYDLGFPGAPILFSWPSDGALFDYLTDREDAEWSAPHLEAFLNELHELSTVNRLHLIAHSMGNQVLIRALSAIALKRGHVSEPLFANVILAAPDFDGGAFKDNVASLVRTLSERWTIYASDRDRALHASRFLTVPRLGTPLVVAEGMDTVDASGIDVTPWIVPELFHSYYADKKRVIADLVGVLEGLPPDKRSLDRRSFSGLPYWVLRGL